MLKRIFKLGRPKGGQPGQGLPALEAEAPAEAEATSRDAGPEASLAWEGMAWRGSMTSRDMSRRALARRSLDQGMLHLRKAPCPSWRKAVNGRPAFGIHSFIPRSHLSTMKASNAPVQLERAERENDSPEWLKASLPQHPAQTPTLASAGLKGSGDPGVVARRVQHPGWSASTSNSRPRNSSAGNPRTSATGGQGMRASSPRQGQAGDQERQREAKARATDKKWPPGTNWPDSRARSTGGRRLVQRLLTYETIQTPRPGGHSNVEPPVNRSTLGAESPETAVKFDSSTPESTVRKPGPGARSGTSPSPSRQKIRVTADSSPVHDRDFPRRGKETRLLESSPFRRPYRPAINQRISGDTGKAVAGPDKWAPAPRLPLSRQDSGNLEDSQGSGFQPSEGRQLTPVFRARDGQMGRESDPTISLSGMASRPAPVPSTSGVKQVSRRDAGEASPTQDQQAHTPSGPAADRLRYPSRREDSRREGPVQDRGQLKVRPDRASSGQPRQSLVDRIAAVVQRPRPSQNSNKTARWTDLEPGLSPTLASGQDPRPVARVQRLEQPPVASAPSSPGDVSTSQQYEQRVRRGQEIIWRESQDRSVSTSSTALAGGSSPSSSVRGPERSGQGRPLESQPVSTVGSSTNVVPSLGPGQRAAVQKGPATSSSRSSGSTTRSRRGMRLLFRRFSANPGRTVGDGTPVKPPLSPTPLHHQSMAQRKLEVATGRLHSLLEEGPSERLEARRSAGPSSHDLGGSNAPDASRDDISAGGLTARVTGAGTGKNGPIGRASNLMSRTRELVFREKQQVQETRAVKPHHPGGRPSAGMLRRISSAGFPVVGRQSRGLNRRGRTADMTQAKGRPQADRAELIIRNGERGHRVQRPGASEGNLHSEREIYPSDSQDFKGTLMSWLRPSSKLSQAARTMAGPEPLALGRRAESITKKRTTRPMTLYRGTVAATAPAEEPGPGPALQSDGNLYQPLGTRKSEEVGNLPLARGRNRSPAGENRGRGASSPLVLAKGKPAQSAEAAVQHKSQERPAPSSGHRAVPTAPPAVGRAPSAPMQVARAVETASTPTIRSNMAGAETFSTSPGPSRTFEATDIEFLAAKVYAYMKEMLLIERERHGRPSYLS